MLIRENIDQEHASSSEDDFLMDKQFRERSVKLTQEMILNNLQDWQLELIEENIREHKYQEEKKKGNINDKTLRELGFKKEIIKHKMKDAPAMPTIERKQVGKSTFETRKSRFKVTTRKYESVITKSKLVKRQIPQNNKELDLLQQDVYGEARLYSSDSESNVKRTGLPQIKKFYQKYRQLDKRVQSNLHNKEAPTAYINRASNLPIVPVPSGLVTHKGADLEMNVNNNSIGDL